ncbi:hypothetical protein [Kangiella sp.]|nr:hypothetical protein [Kangiella sp.]
MIELPDFDTGQYEGSELLMSNGETSLTIRITEQSNFIIGADPDN